MRYTPEVAGEHAIGKIWLTTNTAAGFAIVPLDAFWGTPCVGLFGPVPGTRNGPYGPQHACVEPAAPLRPAWEDRKTDMLSMHGIEVDAVLAATKNLLARSQAA